MPFKKGKTHSLTIKNDKKNWTAYELFALSLILELARSIIGYVQYNIGFDIELYISLSLCILMVLFIIGHYKNYKLEMVAHIIIVFILSLYFAMLSALIFSWLNYVPYLGTYSYMIISVVLSIPAILIIIFGYPTKIRGVNIKTKYINITYAILYAILCMTVCIHYIVLLVQSGYNGRYALFILDMIESIIFIIAFILFILKNEFKGVKLRERGNKFKKDNKNLMDLKQRYESGNISEEEYNQKRKEIIDNL